MHMAQKRQQNPYANPNPAAMQPGFNNMSTAQYSNNYPSTARPNFQPQYQPMQGMNPAAAGFGPNTMMRGKENFLRIFTMIKMKFVCSTSNKTYIKGANMRHSTPSYNTASQAAASQYYNSNGAPVNMGPSAVGNQFVGHQQNAAYVGGQSYVAAAATSQYPQDIASMRTAAAGNLSYQHSPIAGNPTPPLTPANAMPSYLNPNVDIKPNFNDIKAPANIQSKHIYINIYPICEMIKYKYYTIYNI